jgi:hypothetical protein
MNYVFKLKNLSDLEIPGVVVNETITSRHDTDRISEILLLLKNNYRRKFGSLYFRLIGMDLSWATIHATLEVLNMETINDYSNRIYKISKKEIDIDNKSSNKSYLASCCSHTMHRFTRALKRQVKFIDKNNETFAVLCFSLLLNSLDLASSKDIFRLICIVFKSDNYSEEVEKAKYNFIRFSYFNFNNL